MLDYKQKYREIRTKMMEAVDVSFRLGYEEGLKEGEMQAQQMQMQQQAEAEALAAQQGGINPETGQPINPAAAEEGMVEGEIDPETGEELPPEEMGGMEAGTELDSHINELEGLVQKGEKPSIMDMRKAVIKISDIRKAQKNKYIDLKKKKAKSNSAQKKVVNNILKKWEFEAQDTSSGIEKIIKESGIEIKE